ncbi:MAG: TonB-dependent receptor, partial [Bacteroidota bacterium]
MLKLYKTFIGYLLWLCVLGAIPVGAYAQSSIIKGKVMNGKTGDPLPYSSISVNGKNATTADSAGNYQFSAEPGKLVVQVAQIGYEPFEQIVRIGFEERITVNLALTPKENELERVIVSGSRQEKQIVREVMSVTSIKPYLITNTNSATLSDVLNKVPGVSVVDGQALIRGSSGWSYNVGSRVMVLLDDMPLMGPDAGDVQWDLIPIEAAENIEVIKGPSSVLYGSSATSGTVNVRTGWPTNKPETRITFFQGVQENPRNKNSIWWERTTQPFNTGTFMVHKQKFGQFDVVASANGSATRSHIQSNDEFRVRSYLKTRYRFKNIQGLSAGINFNAMIKTQALQNLHILD